MVWVVGDGVVGESGGSATGRCRSADADGSLASGFVSLAMLS